MPGATREQIFEALFILGLSSDSSYNQSVSSRKLLLWGDVDREQRPAIFLAERVQKYKEGERAQLLTSKTFFANFFIYTNSKDVAIPATQLNNLLDSLDAALKSDPAFVMTGKQTLGGLVQNVYIEGDLFFDPGDLDGDGVAIVPVKILVP